MPSHVTTSGQGPPGPHSSGCLIWLYAPPSWSPSPLPTPCPQHLLWLSPSTFLLGLIPDSLLGTWGHSSGVPGPDGEVGVIRAPCGHSQNIVLPRSFLISFEDQASKSPLAFHAAVTSPCSSSSEALSPAASVTLFTTTSVLVVGPTEISLSPGCTLKLFEKLKKNPKNPRHHFLYLPTPTNWARIFGGWRPVYVLRAPQVVLVCDQVWGRWRRWSR